MFEQHEPFQCLRCASCVAHLKSDFGHGLSREDWVKVMFRRSPMMTFDQLCWIATAVYAIHVLEEYAFNWRDWAQDALQLNADWTTFYLTNAVVIVLGIVAAQIAPQTPTLALCFPALMLINATFFHVLPFLLMKGRFSPGLITAVLLFFPIGIFCYWTVFQTGLLTRAKLLASFLGGGLLMAVPILFLKLKERPYFLAAAGKIISYQEEAVVKAAKRVVTRQNG